MPPTVSYLSQRTIAYFSTFPALARPKYELHAALRMGTNVKQVDNVKADIFTVLSGTFLYEECCGRDIVIP